MRNPLNTMVFGFFSRFLELKTGVKIPRRIILREREVKVIDNDNGLKNNTRCFTKVVRRELKIHVHLLFKNNQSELTTSESFVFETDILSGIQIDTELLTRILPQNNSDRAFDLFLSALMAQNSEIELKRRGYSIFHGRMTCLGIEKHTGLIIYGDYINFVDL